MIDKSKRFMRKYVPLEDQETLKGKRLDFDSVAAMFLDRAGITPDRPLVYYMMTQ